MAIIALCAVSFSACSSDDDNDEKEPETIAPTISFSVNNNKYNNNDTVFALDKASVSATNTGKEEVALYFSVTKGTNDIKSVSIKYSNNFVNGLYVTDTCGQSWNGIEKGAKSTNGSFVFKGVYAKYTICVVDSKDSTTNASFILSGTDYKYSSTARGLSNKQTIKIDSKGTTCAKTQLGLSYTAETETAKGKFSTTGKMLKITESQYNEYQGTTAQAFMGDAESETYKEENKTINGTAPFYYLYEYKVGNYIQHYLLKVVSLEGDIATIEVQY